MISTAYPIWKKYISTIETSCGTCVLEYKQASAGETDIFADESEEKNFNALEWLILFINDHGTFENNIILKNERNIKSLMNSFLFRLPIVKKIVNWKINKLTDEIIIEKNKIIMEFLSTGTTNDWYHRIIMNKHTRWKSLFEGVKTKKEDGRKGLYGANIAAVCEKYCISLKDLFSDYTYEQIGWMTDSLIFDSNEFTDEGKRMNDEMFANTPESKEEFDEIMSIVKKYSTFEEHKQKEEEKKMKDEGFILISSGDNGGHDI